MTPRERASLAQQILGNPLLKTVLDDLEKAAMEQGIYAKQNDHETRQSAMAEVRAIRAFRFNLEACLLDNEARKGVLA